MVLIVVRATMKNMKYFIRKEHFDALGKLMLIVSMGWAYFFFNDFMVQWYGGDKWTHFLLHWHEAGTVGWMWFLAYSTNFLAFLVTSAVSPGRIRMKCLRIFPEMCARTSWPLSSSTLNMAFGRVSSATGSLEDVIVGARGALDGAGRVTPARVLALADGRIEHIGTHAELLESSPTYRNLHDKQSGAAHES